MDKSATRISGKRGDKLRAAATWCFCWLLRLRALVLGLHRKQEDGKPRRLRWPFSFISASIDSFANCNRHLTCRNVLCLTLLCLTIFYCLPARMQNLDKELELLGLKINVVRWTANGPTELLPASVTNRRIFFHETSGRGHLTFRQTCTVESAALHNPDRPIQVYITAKRLDFTGTPWLSVLENYPNVTVILMDDAEAYFADTPLAFWYAEGLWRETIYKMVHMSDYMRMLTIKRGGGMYMDLDYVTLKRLDESEFWNFFPIETADMKLLSNSVLHLEKGHRLIKLLIDRLVYLYDPGEYFLHGPSLISNIMARHCGVKRGQPDSNNCTDVRLTPHYEFAPVHNNGWEMLFWEATEERMAYVTNGSYAVHCWSGKSNKFALDVRSDQVYATLARNNCPRAVALADQFPFT